MSLENDSACRTSEQAPETRLPWTRPAMRRLAASQAEQFAAVAPDGLGDQLS